MGRSSSSHRKWTRTASLLLQGKHIDIDVKTLYHLDMIAVTVSSKYQIVIPKEARQALGITSGMRLQAISEPSGLRLVKEPSIDQIRGLLSGMVVDDSTIRSEEERILP